MACIAVCADVVNLEPRSYSLLIPRGLVYSLIVTLVFVFHRVASQIRMFLPPAVAVSKLDLHQLLISWCISNFLRRCCAPLRILGFLACSATIFVMGYSGNILRLRLASSMIVAARFSWRRCINVVRGVCCLLLWCDCSCILLLCGLCYFLFHQAC